MLWDKGLYWLIIIVLTVIAVIFFGIYNRQTVDEKNSTLLVLGWVFLGVDLAIFGYGLYQALFWKK